ncbi:MAG: MBL fold metallo-hydrolase [Pseudomonadota bacterium]
MWKKIGIAAIALVAIAAVLNRTVGDTLMLKVMKKQVVANLSGASFAEFGDGLNIVLCGSGSPFPDVTRAGPCVAVIAGQQVLIIDAGSGSARNLAPSGIPAGKIAAVLLTHYHSDHIDGLGELLLQRWGNAAHTSPTPVIGPTGVEQVVAGFNLAYTQDFAYRVAHHGAKIIPPGGAGGVAQPFELPAPGVGSVVYDVDGLKVTAFAVDHRPIVPAVGYRVDYKGRSAVISGDTVKSANLAQFAKGVDLLVHEALSPELVAVISGSAKDTGAANIEQISHDILNYHTTPVEAAEMAQAAGVKQLLFYHLVPVLPLKRLEPIFLRGVSKTFDGDVTVGKDRTWVNLPPNSSAVNVGRRG